MVTTDRPLTRLEVARYLGLSTERVDQFRRAGLLPCDITPSGRLFDAEAVERLRRQREARQAPAPTAG